MSDGAVVGAAVTGVGAGVNVVGSRVTDGDAEGATGNSIVPKRKKYKAAAQKNPTVDAI